MSRYRPASLLLLLAALGCAAVAVVLGFRWLGTDGQDWPGWLALALALALLDRLLDVWLTPPPPPPPR